MTGIGMAAAAGATFVPLLVASTALNSGLTTFNVAGASGDLYTSASVVIVIVESGGTPPYFDAGGSGVIFDGSSGSGTLSLVPASDGIHNTVGWSGMVVGELAAFHLALNIFDSGTPPQNASSRFPSAGSILIHRTS